MLRIVDDLAQLLAAAQSHGKHWVIDASRWGFAQGLLKLEPYSANEVVGYSIAHAIEAPVPRCGGVWLTNRVHTGKREFGPGRVGVIVEYFPDWKPLSWSEAVERNPKAVAAALALCLLDRHEWGEFGMAAGRVLFIDLERLLPFFDLEAALVMSGEERAEYFAKVR